MTYSVHFRKKVLAVKEKEQLSFSAISKKFNITPTVVKDSILAIGVTKVYPHGFDN